MSKYKNRVRTFHDEKQQEPNILDTLVAPNTGLMDEPIRYYAANEKWATLIEGFLLWLADVPAWRDAQDERYIGIEAIQVFIRGIELMIKDCNDVENCITTSPTIINIENLLTVVQNNITNIQNDVTIINNNITNINQEITNVTNIVNQNTTNVTNNIYQSNPVPIPIPSGLGSSDADIAYGAALYLVRWLNSETIAAFNAAEVVTDQWELLALFYNSFPIFDDLFPLGDGILWLDAVFQSQVNDYIASYTQAFEEAVACEIFCRVKANNWTFTIEIFNEALQTQPQAGTKAQELFNKYGSVSASLLNTVWSTINGTQSANEYFNEILYRYRIGQQYPDPNHVNVCIDCLDDDPCTLPITERWDSGVAIPCNVPQEGTLQASFGTVGNGNWALRRNVSKTGVSEARTRIILPQPLTSFTVTADCYAAIMNVTNKGLYGVSFRDANNNQILRLNVLNLPENWSTQSLSYNGVTPCYSVVVVCGQDLGNNFQFRDHRLDNIRITT